MDGEVSAALPFIDQAGLGAASLALPFPLDAGALRALGCAPQVKEIAVLAPVPEGISGVRSFTLEDMTCLTALPSPLLFAGGAPLIPNLILLRLQARGCRLITKAEAGYAAVTPGRLLLGRVRDVLLRVLRRKPEGHWLLHLVRALRRTLPAARRPTSPEVSSRSDTLDTLYANIASTFPRPCRASGKPLRVAIVNAGLAAGGAERQIVTLMSRLVGAPAVMPVFVGEFLSLPGQNFFLPAMAAAGVRVIEPAARRLAIAQQLAGLPPPQALALAQLPPRLLHDVLTLLPLLQELSPDVVHCWQDPTCLRAGWAALAAGIPRIVLSSRGCRPPRMEGSEADVRAFYRAVSAMPGIVLTNNSAAGARFYDDWLGVHSGTVRVIRNAFETAAMVRAPESKTATLRRQLGIGPGEAVVGGIMRLDPVKRPLLWLETAAAVARRRADVRFVIAGTGSMAAAAKARAAQPDLHGKVWFLEPVPDVARLLSLFDTLLLTSEAEGTPNAAIEAQWLGIPVVTTAVGGAPETIDHGRTGLVVSDEPGQSERLAEAVMACLADGPLRDGARTEGPPLVKARFSAASAQAATIASYGID